MGKKKFVKGSERKQVPRPQPPHSDRRTRRNKTRQEQEQRAIEDYNPTLVILPCEVCGRADGLHTDEDCFK